MGIGLRVVSVADPTHPAEVGYYNPPGYEYGVAVSGDYAYVADAFDGLRVISVANPADPFEVGYCNTLARANAVTVSGSYAYVADGDSGLCVISIADPTHPVVVGHRDTPGDAWCVALDGGYAYVADANWSQGLRVISVADPTRPVEVGYYDTPGNAVGVAVSGGCVYVADDYAGLQIYQFYGAGVEEMPSTGAPTPNSSTVVRGALCLPLASSVLLDIAGRKVMDLLPGPNDVRALAPGVYFVREKPQAPSLKPQAIRKVVITR